MTTRATGIGVTDEIPLSLSCFSASFFPKIMGGVIWANIRWTDLPSNKARRLLAYAAIPGSISAQLISIILDGDVMLKVWSVMRGSCRIVFWGGWWWRKEKHPSVSRRGLRVNTDFLPTFSLAGGPKPVNQPPPDFSTSTSLIRSVVLIWQECWTNRSDWLKPHHPTFRVVCQQHRARTVPEIGQWLHSVLLILNGHFWPILPKAAPRSIFLFLGRMQRLEWS